MLLAKPGRPTQARAAQITDEILAAAGNLFLSDGYDATSMSAIARAVGVPKTTLYKRYADKAELLKAVIEDRVEGWSRTAGTEDAHLPNELLALLRFHVTTMLQWATTAEVQAIRKLAGNLPQGSLGGERPGLPGEENMRRILVRAITELGPPSGIVARHPDVVADFLMTSVAGTIARLEPGLPVSREDASALAATIVAITAGGSAAW